MRPDGVTLERSAPWPGEAGFTFDPRRRAEGRHRARPGRNGQGSGNARLAVRLLDQVTVSQARRITTAAQIPDLATLSTIYAADVPEHVHPPAPPADDWPGQYL
jgi:hypothetical protein